MTEEVNEAAAAAEQTKFEFALQRIYLKDLSYEAPQGPQAFQKPWKPKVNQDLSNKVNKLDDSHYEVVLNLTVTVKDEEDTIYLVEVQQAGIFLARGFEPQQLSAVLNTQCPSILFPYARETIDSLVTKGTFPALMIPPINFDALYMQAMKNAQGQQEENPTVN